MAVKARIISLRLSLSDISTNCSGKRDMSRFRITETAKKTSTVFFLRNLLNDMYWAVYFAVTNAAARKIMTREIERKRIIMLITINSG